MIYDKYDITPDFIEGVPKIAYRNGVGSYEGVVSHETAGYGTAINEIIFERRNWMNGFVHYFVDPDGIRQSADTDYVAYGAGSVANKRYAHVELCRTKDADNFKKSYDMYVWLLALVLHKKGLQVIDGVTFVSHDWVSRNLGGSDHTDPIAYLESWGISWNQHVDNVKAAYAEEKNEGDEVMKLTLNQWRQLGNSLDGMYHKGLINDYTWAEKAYKQELTVGEIAFLNIVIFARDKGIDTDKNIEW